MMKHSGFAKRFTEALSFSDYSTWSQASVGKLFGVSQPTVNDWIKGEKLPKMETAIEICKKLKCNIEWLLTGNGQRLGNMDKTEQKSNVSFIENFDKVPVLDWNQLRSFQMVLEGKNVSVKPTEMRYTENATAKTFMVRVVGDAMSDKFPEGTLLTVEPTLQALPGDYVIAIDEQGEPTFKQLIKDGADLFLAPLNNKYPVRPLTGYKILGVVTNYGNSLK